MLRNVVFALLSIYSSFALSDTSIGLDSDVPNYLKATIALEEGNKTIVAYAEAYALKYETSAYTVFNIKYRDSNLGDVRVEFGGQISETKRQFYMPGEKLFKANCRGIFTDVGDQSRSKAKLTFGSPHIVLKRIHSPSMNQSIFAIYGSDTQADCVALEKANLDLFPGKSRFRPIGTLILDRIDDQKEFWNRYNMIKNPI